MPHPRDVDLQKYAETRRLAGASAQDTTVPQTSHAVELFGHEIACWIFGRPLFSQRTFKRRRLHWAFLLCSFRHHCLRNGDVTFLEQSYDVFATPFFDWRRHELPTRTRAKVRVFVCTLDLVLTIRAALHGNGGKQFERVRDMIFWCFQSFNSFLTS